MSVTSLKGLFSKLSAVEESTWQFVTSAGGELSIEWREGDDHVLMTGTADFEFEGRFDPALFASVA